MMTGKKHYAAPRIWRITDPVEIARVDELFSRRPTEGSLMKTRADHIAWCKTRALEHLEPGSDYSLMDVVAGFILDLYRHEDTLDDVQPVGSGAFALIVAGADREALREFISGIG